jgi:hypothetical protein
MIEGLGISGDAPRLVPGCQKEMLSLVPIVRTGVVKGEDGEDAFKPLREKYLKALGNALMSAPALCIEDARVSSFLNQRVCKAKLHVRMLFLVLDKLHVSQAGQNSIKLPHFLRKILQDTVEEISTNDRCRPQKVLGIVVEAVNASEDHTFD